MQLAPAYQKLQYDDDGNILDDGVWQYTWDAENRLVKMRPTVMGLDSGMLAQVLAFRYDYQHRRVEKKYRRWRDIRAT